ncbi:Protein of unknown function [Bacillus mycoides]|nr:Protein of unknown function [Bacillus mycoides]
MRSFRSKMVMLFALSMIFAAGITYLLYEGLREWKYSYGTYPYFAEKTWRR